MSTYRDKLCRTCGYFRLFGKQYLNLRESTLSNNSFHWVLCANCGFGVNTLLFWSENALAARLLPVTVGSPAIRPPRRVIGQSKGLVKDASVTSRVCAFHQGRLLFYRAMRAGCEVPRKQEVLIN